MQTSITYRQALQTEIEELQILNDQIMVDNPVHDPDFLVNWGQSDNGKQYFTELLHDETAFCLVAEVNNMLIGYIAARPKVFGHRLSKYVELENLGVIPEYHRQGIGKQLYDAFVAWAKEQGFEKVYLESYFANIKARAFYEAQGFAPIDISYEKDLWT